MGLSAAAVRRFLSGSRGGVSVELVAAWLFLCAFAVDANHAAAQSSRPKGDLELELQLAVPEGESLDWLSRDRYSRRQQATLQMWSDRENSREKVQEAARDPDPEVSARARWILRQWRRGSLPETPPEIARLLQAADGPQAIERLLEAGQFQAAIVAIEESAGTADREAIQARISDALSLRFPIYVHLAILGEAVPDLLTLVDLVADNKEMAVCRVNLMQQLGIEVGESNLLPDLASLWTLRERERAEVLLWLLLGDGEKAIKLAAKSREPDLLHQCRMVLGRWRELVAENAPKARLAESGKYEHARLWSLTMMAADRAGDDVLRREAVEALSTMEHIDTDEGRLAADLRWKSLVVHGEVDAALKIVSAIDPVEAATVASEASRIDQAFEILGYPQEQVDVKLGEWIDDTLSSRGSPSESALVPESGRLLALMKCLIKTGRTDAAWQIAKRCSTVAGEINGLTLRDHVLYDLLSTRRSDWIIQLCVGPDNRPLTAQATDTLAYTLPDCDAPTFEVVQQVLATMMRGATRLEQVQAAEQLIRGELPEKFDPDTDFRRFFEFVTVPRQQRGRGTIVRRRGIIANLNIVRLFLRHDQTSYAMQCLNMLAQGDDAKAIFFLAEQELDGGRTDAAEELFGRVFDIVLGQDRVSGQFKGVDDVALAVKARIGQWMIARRNGDLMRSEELEREIRLALCSPSTRQRTSIAEYLGDRGEVDTALAAYETVMKMTMFGNDQQSSLFSVARFFSPLAQEDHPGKAARWFDLAVGGSLDSVSFRAGAYVTFPLIVERWALEDAIGREDQSGVAIHIERILRLDPLDIDFAERLLPELRGTEMAPLADDAINRIIDFGIAYTDRYPFDAMSRNNLAWIAAMNQRRVDEALDLARKAVFLEPDSAIYRDTLAELLFLAGRSDEALQIEKACLLDDPTQWHLHEQIEKYTRAISAQ